MYYVKSRWTVPLQWISTDLEALKKGTRETVLKILANVSPGLDRVVRLGEVEDKVPVPVLHSQQLLKHQQLALNNRMELIAETPT